MVEITNVKVYMHTSPSNKVYIGITSQEPKLRWGNGCNYSSNEHFDRAIKKYGWDNFKHEILFSNLSLKEAKEKEIELIAFYDSTNPEKGYNITNGGESGNGYHHTKLAKQKISASMKGRKQSEESKAKISEANKNIPRRKGFTLSDETKKKIGEAHKGVPKPKSEEHKRKISETKRGVILSEETKKKMSESRNRWCSKNLEKILQLSLDGEVLRKWDSQSEAFRELGIKQSTFQLHVSNGKPLNGFIYIKEYNYKV
jgi:group I intron endonuclease